MPNLIFNYEAWNVHDDVQLSEPGNRLGYATVNGSLPFGTDPNDSSSSQAINGVASLMAGCIEYFRELGLTNTDVQSRINAAMASNRGSHLQAISKRNNQAKIYDISDSQNLEHRLNPEKVREWSTI